MAAGSSVERLDDLGLFIDCLGQGRVKKRLAGTQPDHMVVAL